MFTSLQFSPEFYFTSIEFFLIFFVVIFILYYDKWS